MAPRGAQLDHHVGQLEMDLPEEIAHSLDLFAQPLAQRFRAVHADAECRVRVHFDVLKIVSAQEFDDALTLIIPHLGHAEVPEAAVAHGQWDSVPLQQPFGLRKPAAFPAHGLELEPDARKHAAAADVIQCVLQPAGEQEGRNLPVARVLRPAAGDFGVPARVDDEIGQLQPLHRVGNAADAVLLRRSPGGAVFVEQRRQALLRFRHVQPILGVADQALACVLHAAGGHGEHRLGRVEGPSGLHNLEPVAELPVGQSAGEGEALVAAGLQLPRRAAGQLRRPDHAELPVLHRREGEIAAHWHGAHLSPAVVKRASAPRTAPDAHAPPIRAPAGPPPTSG